jgi:hypothetical protein
MLVCTPDQQLLIPADESAPAPAPAPAPAAQPAYIPQAAPAPVMQPAFQQQPMMSTSSFAPNPLSMSQQLGEIRLEHVIYVYCLYIYAIYKVIDVCACFCVCVCVSNELKP